MPPKKRKTNKGAKQAQDAQHIAAQADSSSNHDNTAAMPDVEAGSSRPGKRPRSSPSKIGQSRRPAAPRADDALMDVRKSLDVLQAERQLQKHEFDIMKLDLEDAQGHICALEDELQMVRESETDHRLKSEVKIRDLALQLTELEYYKQKAKAASELATARQKMNSHNERLQVPETPTSRAVAQSHESEASPIQKPSEASPTCRSRRYTRIGASRHVDHYTGSTDEGTLEGT